MSGTFSSNVNFTVDQFLRRAGNLSVLQEIERQNENDVSGCSLQFPKHHKRRHKKIYRMVNHLQIFSNTLTDNNIFIVLLMMLIKFYRYLALMKF